MRPQLPMVAADHCAGGDTGLYALPATHYWPNRSFCREPFQSGSQLDCSPLGTAILALSFFCFPCHLSFFHPTNATVGTSCRATPRASRAVFAGHFSTLLVYSSGADNLVQLHANRLYGYLFSGLLGGCQFGLPALVVVATVVIAATKWPFSIPAPPPGRQKTGVSRM